jgi:hypothetical protein
MNQVFGPPVPAVLAAGTATASAPIFDLTQTWNNGAVTFTGYKLNITDTASAAASLLVDLQVGGTTVFNVSKTRGSVLMPQGDAATVAGASIYFGTSRTSGNPIAIGAYNNSIYFYAAGQQMLLVTTAKIAMNSGQSLTWSASSTANDGSTDAGFSRIAAKVVGYNAGAAGTYAGSALVLGLQTVAQLPVAAAGNAGARATVSDASAPSWGATVTGGGAVVSPVYSDGSAWKVG